MAISLTWVPVTQGIIFRMYEVDIILAWSGNFHQCCKYSLGHRNSTKFGRNPTFRKQHSLGTMVPSLHASLVSMASGKQPSWQKQLATELLIRSHSVQIPAHRPAFTDRSPKKKTQPSAARALCLFGMAARGVSISQWLTVAIVARHKSQAELHQSCCMRLLAPWIDKPSPVSAKSRCVGLSSGR